MQLVNTGRSHMALCHDHLWYPTLPRARDGHLAGTCWGEVVAERTASDTIVGHGFLPTALASGVGIERKYNHQYKRINLHCCIHVLVFASTLSLHTSELIKALALEEEA